MHVNSEKTPWIISIKIRNNMHKTFKPFVNDVCFLRPNSVVNYNGFMNWICWTWWHTFREYSFINGSQNISATNVLRLNECVQDKPEPEKFPTAPQTQSRASNKIELMVVLTRATFFKCHCHIKPIPCANILRMIAGMSQSIFNVIVIFIWQRALGKHLQ